MKRSLVRTAVMVLALGGAVACGPLKNAEVFNSDFWSSSPMSENTEAELGMAELAKGEMAKAEAHFQQALKQDSKDVYALLGQALLYQSTGQQTRARESYEAIMALDPGPADRFAVWATLEPRPISEIAAVNLDLLNSGEAMGAPAGTKVGASRVEASKPDLAARPHVSATMGRTVSSDAAPASPAPSDETSLSMLDPADTRIAQRFQALKILRDQGLVTEAEYTVRRQANIGALLPLTTPPPAAGLDRPVPVVEQIAGRLRAIGRALEVRAMTVQEHASERTFILDALMPAAPVKVANPPPPPQGLMEAADAVRRLEILKGEKLITSDEYARERRAIEQAMQSSAPAGMEVAEAGNGAAGQGAKSEAGQEGMAGGAKPAVHLASYRSEQAADRGWTQLRRAHEDLLGGLGHEITSINLGPKGTFYRLKAGPVENRAAAEALCRRLKSRRQFCEPTFLGNG